MSDDTIFTMDDGSKWKPSPAVILFIALIVAMRWTPLKKYSHILAETAQIAVIRGRGKKVKVQ